MLRDIHTSSYQICRIEEKEIQQPQCNLDPEVRNILEILWKRGEIAPLFLQYFVTSCLISMLKQGPGPSCSKLTMSLVNDSLKF